MSYADPKTAAALTGNATVPNAQRLLWAGFFCIFAAGVGFGVRGAILVDWGRAFAFTQAELGEITGGGLVGFGIIIILGSLIADKVGYGTLMILAFIMHVLSAILQMCTPLVFDAFGRDGVYWSLYIAMFMFSIANGICEVVVNPLVAALFPKEKTHYLNILHAGWPGGLIAGGVVAYVCNDVVKVHWIIQMSMFLVPVAIYGVMMAGQHFPRSEASQAGVSYATMLAEFAAPVLLLLLVIHALVGYVELGTDSWITKITGSIMENRGAGVLLFIYTSGLMFALRFFAGPIEHAISPLGLLFSCAVIAAIGLTMFGHIEGVVMCVLAATVYGVGKTFFWPTMLAVVSERFPKGGALTLGAVGGVGMLSAGLLGGPGIGFQQDYYASKQLKEKAPATYQRYAAEKENTFLGFFEAKGLDSAKVGLLVLEDKVLTNRKEAVKAADSTVKKAKETAATDAEKELTLTLRQLRESTRKEPKELAAWWEDNKQYAADDANPVEKATLFGGQMALQLTAIVPAIMAVLYLVLILYFRVFHGGYKPVVIDEVKSMDAAMEKALGAPGSAEA
ncbi:MAG: MFS transporter [Planctomycetes bacterium]|nr:MFS transporter [Planctomycetota bacterium]